MTSSLRASLVAPAAFAVVVMVACTHAPKPGELCTEGAVCSDPSHLLTCRAFTFHDDPCRGPSGCTLGRCDQRTAMEGDSCGQPGVLACSVDDKELVRCDGSAMTPIRACRGERGCYRETAESPPTCDIGLAAVGDACDTPRLSRCGPEGKSILECSTTSNRYEVDRECLGPRGCFKTAHFGPGPTGAGYLACDAAVGDVGEPCEGRAHAVGNGGVFCSRDAKEHLRCAEGLLVSAGRCACHVTWQEDSAYSVGCDDTDAGGGRSTHTVRAWSAPLLSLADPDPQPGR